MKPKKRFVNKASPTAVLEPVDKGVVYSRCWSSHSSSEKSEVSLNSAECRPLIPSSLGFSMKSAIFFITQTLFVKNWTTGDLSDATMFSTSPLPPVQDRLLPSFYHFLPLFAILNIVVVVVVVFSSASASRLTHNTLLCCSVLWFRVCTLSQLGLCSQCDTLASLRSHLRETSH